MSKPYIRTWRSGTGWPLVWRWYAQDRPDGLIGHGRTESEAIAKLKQDNSKLKDAADHVTATLRLPRRWWQALADGDITVGVSNAADCVLKGRAHYTIVPPPRPAASRRKSRANKI